MKSKKVEHIFASFLYLIQTGIVLCQSQIQDPSTPSSYKYAFAHSYAWKFRFPVTYSGGAQDSNTQWRPAVRQEQTQLPNGYLIAPNYQGMPVKEPSTEQQYIMSNNQGQQFTPTFNQNPVNGQQANIQRQGQNQQFQQQSIKDPQGQELYGASSEGRVPLLNERGQQIGWQFFPLPKLDQAVMPMEKPSQQIMPYYPSSDTSAQQTSTYGAQGQQPLLPVVAQLPEGQPFGQTSPTTQKVVSPQQPCIPQTATNQCPPTSVSSRFSSDIQNQELNRFLQSYQQNLLQAMNIMQQQQQQTYQGAHVSSGYNPPVAIAGATISDDPNGNSHLNSFTYTSV